MTTKIHWQLDVAAEPARGEPSARPKLPGLVRDLRRPTQNRFDYYAQVAVAAAQGGFDGLYLPYRDAADETRIVAASVAREARHIALIPEFPASVGSAVYAAKQAVTFQRHTGGRLGWGIAPDADAATRTARGDHIGDEKLPQRLDEFLTVARGVHGHKPFTFKGEFFEVENGGFEDPLNRVAFPTVYLQGESEEALTISARLGDVHLFAATANLLALIEGLDGLAKQAGRAVAFGVVQPVLVRETDAEAAEEAARTPQVEGTIIGSYDTVADGLAALAAQGISHFVLSATPQLEEAYRFGQHVLPRLRTRLFAHAKAA
jgi:alkanesulfonate monooxygenase